MKLLFEFTIIVLDMKLFAQIDASKKEQVTFL